MDLDTIINGFKIFDYVIIGSSLITASYLLNKKQIEARAEKRAFLSEIEENFGPEEKYIAVAIMSKYDLDERRGANYTKRFKNSMHFVDSIINKSNNDFVHEAYRESSRLKAEGM